MTDQDTADEGTRLPMAKPQLSTGGTVAPIIPTTEGEVYRIAQWVSRANMAPRSLDTPEKIAVAIMHGMEVGLTPMVAIQSIAVINGSPSLWGDGLLGVVRGSGLLEVFDETFSRDSDDNAIAATCRVKRKGQDPLERTFTRAQAVKAGLAAKKGTWQEYPERMLQMRARSWALRDGFADVLKGLGSAEETVDGGHLVEQDDGSYAPPPRPQRQDFEDSSDALVPASDGDVIEDAAETDQPVGANKVIDTFAYIDLDGVEHAADDAEIAAQGFEQALDGASDPQAARNLWESNEAFRADLKAADPKRHLALRQFYADVTGAVA